MFEENDLPENADGDRRRTRMFFPDNADAKFHYCPCQAQAGRGGWYITTSNWGACMVKLSNVLRPDIADGTTGERG